MAAYQKSCLEHFSNIMIFDERHVIEDSTGYFNKKIFIYNENVSAADTV